MKKTLVLLRATDMTWCVCALALFAIALSGCDKRPLFGAKKLFSAIWQYDTNAVSELLVAGVSADSIAKTVGREPALVDATKFGYLPIVELLLEHGADPNLCDRSGYSALYYAFNSPYLEPPNDITGSNIVNILWTRKASLNGKGITNAIRNLNSSDARYPIGMKLQEESNSLH